MVLETEKWTESLKNIRPVLKQLLYKGEINLLLDEAPKLAIVGSRRMSEYGKRVIERWMPVLVQKGITIVSGFMYGVDQAAHFACLENGGKTIAVLGWGIDKEPVAEDAKLYQKILEVNSLIVSEYEGKYPADRWTFPARNRVVAGVANTVLVVEAAEKSGSLITARLARKLGKTLLAVPGEVTRAVAKGTNGLIKSGQAQIVCSAEEVVAAMGLGKGQIGLPFEVEEKDEILCVLENGGRSIDELVRILGLTVAEVTERITNLQIEEKVEEKEGKFVSINIL